MMKTDYGLPDLSGLLPERPIAVRRDGFADRLTLPFLALVLVAMSLGTLVMAGPNLYADYQVKRDPVEVPGAQITDGACKSRKFTVNCKAEISYPRGSERGHRKVDFSFLGASSGDYDTDIIAEKGHPENITLSLAIDEFWSRLAGATLLVVLGVVGAPLMVQRFFQLSATVKALKEPARLQPIWARVTLHHKRWGKERVNYAPLSGMKKGLGVASVLGKGETLWEHEDTLHGDSFVLTVRHPDAKLPVMLDEAFGRLDLTPQEAAAARAARDGLFRTLSAG